MLSAHKIRIFQSLDKRKSRQKYNLFLVEGNKTIREIPSSGYKIKEIFSTAPLDFPISNAEFSLISESELRKISFLQNPKDSVAVCEIPEQKLSVDVPLRIVLDGIRDPGNLGTIIRLADWFGISEIVCSNDTADLYNPKVIQASMGSFLRVNIVYTDLKKFLKSDNNVNLGADMDGENIYKYSFPEKLNLVLGNEANGLRPETIDTLNNKISIPRFGNLQNTESLNVSMAAGIILGQIFSKK